MGKVFSFMVKISLAARTIVFLTYSSCKIERVLKFGELGEKNKY